MSGIYENDLCQSFYTRVVHRTIHINQHHRYFVSDLNEPPSLCCGRSRTSVVHVYGNYNPDASCRHGKRNRLVSHHQKIALLLLVICVPLSTVQVRWTSLLHRVVHHHVLTWSYHRHFRVSTSLPTSAHVSYRGVWRSQFVQPLWPGPRLLTHQRVAPTMAETVQQTA